MSQLTPAARRARRQSAICSQCLIDVLDCIHDCYAPDDKSLAAMVAAYLILLRINACDPEHAGKWISVNRLGRLTGFDRKTVRKVCRDAVKHGVLEARGGHTGPYRLCDAYVIKLVENVHHLRMVGHFITAGGALRSLDGGG